MWIDKCKVELPGPASYDVPFGIVPKPVTLGAKIQNKIELTPGPGSYEVKFSASAKSLKSPVVKIGTTKRVEIFVTRENEPGPADYVSTESSLKRNSGPSFGIKPADIINDTPGPLSYTTEVKSPMKHGVIPRAKK